MKVISETGGMRVYSRGADPDPVFEMGSDPDPDFKMGSDPDPDFEMGSDPEPFEWRSEAREVDEECLV